MAAGEAPFDLFVYGTLQRGFAAHRRLCGAAVYLGAAEVVGSLRLHPHGYPVLVVPPSLIVGRTSGDLELDARRAGTAARVTPGALGEWRWIRGEILRFHRPRDVRPIDQYEGPEPGAAATYERVLVPLRSPSARVAWTFAAAFPERAAALPLHSGHAWP